MNLLIRSAFIIVAIIVIVAAVLLMFSDSQDDVSVETDQNIQTKTNTLFPGDTIKDTTEKPGRPSSLSPGHAQVEMTISEIQDGQLTAEVHRVLGYGSSTKPLTSGEKINITADTYMKNRSVDTTALKGKRILATISVRQQLSLGETTGKAEWALVKLAESH